MTRIECAGFASIALWLVPILVLQWVRARRDRAVWQIALDVPFAVALDLLGILTLTRWLRLEDAIILSRPLWAAGGVALVVWRRRRGSRPAWPSALHPRDLLAAGTAAAFALAVCAGISRVYVVWDMQWHIPLVSTLETEKLPFVNALSPKEVLHYHFAGDVLAGALRTLSFDVVSAPWALHTGHDVMFAAMAATLTLLWIGLGQRRWWSAILGGFAVVLQGPIPIRGGLGHSFFGYAYHDFINLSYRPHVPIAGLMMVGVLGSVAVRATFPRAPSITTWPVLVAAVAQMSVTDETSTGLLGLALGVAWLVDFRLIAPSRRAGVFVFVALAAVFVGTNLALSGSLAPGGPVQRFGFVADARMPALIPPDAPLALSTTNGKIVFFADFLPLFAAGIGISLVASRLRSRTHAGAAVLVWTLIGVCAILATHVDINGDAKEAQRFFFAPFFGCFVLGILFAHRLRAGSFGAMMILLGVAVPAVYSVYCAREEAPKRMADYATPQWGNAKLFELDCRRALGAHWGERAEPAYVDAADFYEVAACRPVLNLGTPVFPWPTRINPTIESTAQLHVLDADLLPAGANLDAFCDRRAETNDEVCKRAVRSPSTCRAAGERMLRCVLTSKERGAILRPAKGG